MMISETASLSAKREARSGKLPRLKVCATDASVSLFFSEGTEGNFSECGRPETFFLFPIQIFR